MISTKQNILDFFEKYLKFKENKTKPVSSMNFSTPPRFHIGVKNVAFTGYSSIMPLDEEDLDYLANKYSKILMEEHANNVKTLTDGYNAIMGKIKECLNSENINK